MSIVCDFLVSQFHDATLHAIIVDSCCDCSVRQLLLHLACYARLLDNVLACCCHHKLCLLEKDLTPDPSLQQTIFPRNCVTELLKPMQLPTQFPAPGLPSHANADGSSTNP